MRKNIICIAYIIAIVTIMAVINEGIGMAAGTIWMLAVLAVEIVALAIKRRRKRR